MYDPNMVQPTNTGFPSLQHIHQQERVAAVNFVLADMQRLLRTEIEPKTLAAMRDYMVTQLGHFQPFAKLGEFQPFDRLFLRNASIQILIRDGTDRLHDLYRQAQALLTDLDDGEAFLQTCNLSHQEALKQNAALKAQMVMRDADSMTLRTEIQLLEQSLEGYKDILQNNVEEREQARKTIQQRDQKLEEEREINNQLNKECENTKRVVERVGAERDVAKKDASELDRQLQELNGRLQETERLYRALDHSMKDPMNTGPPQSPAAAVRGMPTSPGIGASIPEKTPGPAPTIDRTTSLGGTEVNGSGSGRGAGSTSAEHFGQHVVKEGKSAWGSTEGKTENNSLSGGTSAKKHGSTRIVKPCMPLLPPKPTKCAKPRKKQEQSDKSPQGKDDNVPDQACNKAKNGY